MERGPLVGKISEYISIRKKGIVEREVNVQDMSFSNLRDAIIGVGKILEEDFEISTYVVDIPAGAANMNSAVVAIRLNNSCVSIIGYAKEGLINQHTAKKAIDKVIERISKYTITMV